MKEASEINLRSDWIYFILLFVLLMLVTCAPILEQPPIKVQKNHYLMGNSVCRPNSIESITGDNGRLYLYCTGGEAPWVWDEEDSTWLPAGRFP